MQDNEMIYLSSGKKTMYSRTENNLWTSLNPLELNWENIFSSLFSPHTWRYSLHQDCKLLKAQILSLWCLYFVFDFDILILVGLFFLFPHTKLKWMLLHVTVSLTGVLMDFGNSGEGLMVCLGKQVKPKLKQTLRSFKGKNLKNLERVRFGSDSRLTRSLWTYLERVPGNEVKYHFFICLEQRHHVINSQFQC